MARKAGPTDGSRVIFEDSADGSPEDQHDRDDTRTPLLLSDPVDATELPFEPSLRPTADTESEVHSLLRVEAVPGKGSLEELANRDALVGPTQAPPGGTTALGTGDSNSSQAFTGAEPPSDTANTGANKASSHSDPESVASETTSHRDWAPAATADRERARAVASPPDPPARRGGVGSLLLGGFIAAARGFGAAWLAQDRFGVPGPRLPADLEERLANLEARPLPDAAPLTELQGRLAEAEARLSVLEEAPPVPGSNSSPDLDVLREETEAALAGVREVAATLEERVAALEARPAAPAEASLGSLAIDPGPALATPQVEAPVLEPAPDLGPRLEAFEADLSALQDTLSQVAADLDALRTQAASSQAALSDLGTRVGSAESAVAAIGTRLDEAEAASAAAVEEARNAAATLAETQSRAAQAEVGAQRAAALADLDAAIDSGQPFEAILSQLGSDVPESLAQVAAEGVPSVAALRETFPDAARAGLEAARAQGLAEDGDGVTGFLWNQLSLRSTAPREGNDPDAVLSRAEAALAAGRLDDALVEVAELPEPVRNAMSDWIESAAARDQALTALATLRRGEPDPAPAD